LPQTNTTPRPDALAGIAYCWSRCAQHAEAIFEYDVAEKAGFKTAALYNDRAFSRICRNDLDAAGADLDAALLIDPGSGAAYHNRAFLALLRWQRTNDARFAEAGWADATRAIDLGPVSCDVYFDAACLAGAAKRPDDALRLPFARPSRRVRIRP